MESKGLCPIVPRLFWDFDGGGGGKKDVPSFLTLSFACCAMK